MALSVTMTDAVGRLVKPDTNVASLGYPDVIAPMELVRHILGGAVETLSYRDDSGLICKRHGLSPREIPDAKSFFLMLGADLDVYDIIKERGCEILCDLNYPMRLTKKYDTVLDVGTSEHCFNIAQAIMNMAEMVAVGGHIIHENPFNCGNHGFYSLNPTWYADFYEANGFEIVDLHLASRDGSGVKPPPTKRFRYTESEINVFAVARRVEVKPFVFPVQSKYAGLIPATPAAVDNRATELANV